VGDDRARNAPAVQAQAKVQARYAGANDSDVPCPHGTLLCCLRLWWFERDRSRLCSVVGPIDAWRVLPGDVKVGSCHG